MKKFIPILLLALLVPVLASAQQVPLSPGTFSVSAEMFNVNGLFYAGDASDLTFSNDGSIQLVAMESWASFGYFVYQGLEIGPYINFFKPMAEGSASDLDVGIFMNYYIPAGTVLPFVGVSTYYNNVTSDIAGDQSIALVSRVGAAIPVPGLKITPFASMEFIVWINPEYSSMDIRGDLNLGIKAFF